MNRLSVSGQNADQNLEIEIEFKSESKNYKLQFLPHPCDTIKHSFEPSNSESFRLTLIMLILQLSKFNWRIYNSKLS